VLAAFRATGTRTMIHGHTHRPAEHTHEVDGAPARRLVLDAWYEHGSVLTLDGSGFSRREIAFG
jgi:UDP-2,3-diacylglucosamine hydrolase